ncbi:MAG TPA: biotin--[acetyl-CoA-carboxylase] ligase [Streptosporangiaceae bacterium]|nr:biotin--[acetyl-CoA-carboxylase] ligase [Streptosporangiaceae bacterium]
MPRSGAHAGTDGLRPDVLNRELVRPGGLWRDIRVVASTGSTNTDLIAAARSGAAEGLVLVAEEQTGGRGRLGRQWVSPPGASLTFSVLLRPAAVPPSRRAWAPLLTGVAVAAALRAETAVQAQLKWPNDVLAGEAKLAGILAESRADAIVVGVGLNVSASRADLAVPTATSLLAAGASVLDRGRLLGALLAELERRYTDWVTDPAAEASLHAEYTAMCVTLGKRIRVELPDGSAIRGLATGVDRLGRLEVTADGGVVAVSAGDVVHVR